jgi:hypothetical protein
MDKRDELLSDGFAMLALIGIEIIQAVDESASNPTWSQAEHALVAHGYVTRFLAKYDPPEDDPEPLDPETEAAIDTADEVLP